METILITGGTGLVGKALTKQLIERGYQVIILTRKKIDSVQQSTDKNVENKLCYAFWDVENKIMDKWAIEKADHIIHLAGANVFDQRWTKKYRTTILDSRTKTGELLLQYLSSTTNQLKSFISASAIGWYGPDKGSNAFVETDVADKNFLGETCSAWEKSVEKINDLKKRLVILRIGIVLSKDGGAFVEFEKTIPYGIASILGNGKQIISWIHIEDLCRAFIKSIEDTRMSGVYNAVAPMPISNKELILQIAKKIRKSFYIPIYIPSFLLKLILGERSIEILKSTTVSSKKLKDSDFTFLYPDIDSAISDLLNKH